jgi:hypothetical protein
MIVKKSNKKSKLRIDLTGPDGSAFSLLGIAKKLCRQNGLEKIAWPQIEKEMTSGDYENLVQTLEKYFGSIIIIER